MGKPKAVVDVFNCLSCGGCVSVCPVDAVIMKNKIAFVLSETCISCEQCVNTCPVGAMTMED
ncbi:MAG: 4Fe-4S binding protein [Candidatus Thermoplasmatota archaeon]|nr:4Fe-4S binding protein [Candidatus Thermoplasmatota archaeon]